MAMIQEYLGQLTLQLGGVSFHTKCLAIEDMHNTTELKNTHNTTSGKIKQSSVFLLIFLYLQKM